MLPREPSCLLCSPGSLGPLPVLSLQCSDLYYCVPPFSGASLVAQMVKSLPAMWETQIKSQGWEDLLEKEMATQPQYSCLGNPMDREAWRATVHGVEKESDTTERLTQQQH